MKGAIFDIDGTLLDSMGVWEVITQKFFDKHKLDYNEHHAGKFREFTLAESCAYIKENFSVAEDEEQISQELKSMAAFEYANNIKLKPYAKEYITKLYNSGVRLAIATSGFAELCRSALTRCGVWEMFDAVALSSEVGVNKSNPDVYLLASRRIGIDPKDCTVYEDILSGLQGAKKAGMTAVGIYDELSSSSHDEMKKIADKWINSWSELL